MDKFSKTVILMHEIWLFKKHSEIKQLYKRFFVLKKLYRIKNKIDNRFFSDRLRNIVPFQA